MGRTVARLLLLSSGAALAALVFAFCPSGSVGNALQGKILIGIDADPTGNTATSLGSIENCVSVQTGQSFNVDVFIENIVELGGWNSTISFDPAIVRLTSLDVQLFMAAAPDASLVNLSDDVPNDTGEFSLAVADLGGGVGESGDGVLARLGLEAIGSGVSDLQLGNLAIFNSKNEAQEATGPDNIYRGATSNATVAVDAPCPEEAAAPTPAASPTGTAPTPATTSATTSTATATPATVSSNTVTPAPARTGTPEPQQSAVSQADDDGFPWAVVGGVAGGLGAVVVLGLALVWRFRQAR